MRRTGFRFLNTTTPTHYSLTGRNAWNLLDVALVCSSCVSLRTSTVISKLLGSDHSVVLTTANANTIPEANDFPKWNFTKADWPPLPPPLPMPIRRLRSRHGLENFWSRSRVLSLVTLRMSYLFMSLAKSSGF